MDIAYRISKDLHGAQWQQGRKVVPLPMTSIPVAMCTFVSPHA